jgi:hypothetical protein
MYPSMVIKGETVLDGTDVLLSWVEDQADLDWRYVYVITSSEASDHTELRVRGRVRGKSPC